jgi:hypothetical protein
MHPTLRYILTKASDMGATLGVVQRMSGSIRTMFREQRHLSGDPNLMSGDMVAMTDNKGAMSGDMSAMRPVLDAVRHRSHVGQLCPHVPVIVAAVVEPVRFVVRHGRDVAVRDQ